jgi:hypothetical protein
MNIIPEMKRQVCKVFPWAPVAVANAKRAFRSFIKPNKKNDFSGDVKDENFNFQLIEYYFKHKNKTDAHIVNDKTINDIDFYELFEYIDRTHSKIGQQYLFDKLLTIDHNPNFDEQESLINFFTSDEQKRQKVQSALSQLNKRDAYYIVNLIYDHYIHPPKWYWVIKSLSLLSITVFLFALFFHQIFIYLVPLVIINMIIHNWNKWNILTNTDSIVQLSILKKQVNYLFSLDIPSDNGIRTSIESLKKLDKKMLLFSYQAKVNTTDMEMIFLGFLEYIKIFFLLEPLVLFSVLKKLDEKRNDIQNLFDYCGKIDSAIAVMSLRKSLPYYSMPILSGDVKKLQFEDIYHPLIPHCVSNSLTVNNKSILLTGSNMSGKTTFVRTVAINVLLAQTINTAFAKKIELSPMRIFSAIRISDDLFSDKSYYFEEVLTIKDMIDESQSPLFANLYLLDEIFKGTNTIERIAAGKAVLSYLNRSHNIVFVATHDIELTDLLHDSYDLYHFTEVVENQQIHFDYKLKSGKMTTKNAIRILELNGYPPEVVNEAIDVSSKLVLK